ncbi:PASTA domain-containing protein [Nocardioides sp.]|uniref:PASTA domain-containing protein n=1 Tax=Nocardioides sp. TaxID=35761 RepID=UPI00286AF95B|nr:PASTA domain-containing protein [Nocardioides sp.]
MNDLTEMLERSAADVPVGPPPLAAMHRTARRRRSYAVGLAAAAAVVVATGSVALWPSGDVAPRDLAPTASDSPSEQTRVEEPPTGFRWVGIGQAVVAVPDAWGTNEIRCGTPTRDTVVVDVGVIETCATSYPRDTTSVWIRSREPVDQVGSWSPIEVDGEPALRSPDEGSQSSGEAAVYRAAVYLPERDVVFEATSSVSAEAVSEALGRITIVDTLVAVPGFSPANYGGGDQSKAGERYVRALLDEGLRATVVVRPTPQAGVVGFVLDASPAPGTVVEPGSTVRVTVTG